jgi:hypothetical protein
MFLLLIIVAQVTLLSFYAAYERLYLLLPLTVIAQYHALRYCQHHPQRNNIMGALTLAEMALLVVYIFATHMYYLIVNLVIIAYLVFKYWDGDEETGYRAWNRVRSWPIWRRLSSVDYEFMNKADLGIGRKRQQPLYLVVGNVTYLGMMNTFGLHGNIFTQPLNFMVPWPLLAVPILRDVLLWMGAVSEDVENIVPLLNQGKQIAYAPGEWTNYLNACNPRGEEVQFVVPDLALFQMLREAKVAIIPVLISNELSRYSIGRSGRRMFNIQQWCASHWRWPFPMLAGIKIFGQEPPPRLAVTVGAVIESGVYESEERLREAYLGLINGMMRIDDV